MKKSDKENVEPVQLKKEKELFINNLINGNVEFAIFSNQFTSFHNNPKQLLKNTDNRERKSNTELQTDNTNGLNGTDKILDKLTVLVADDDEVARIFLSELLEGKCKKVLFAKNGKEAVELYQTNDRIDMVLMDIKMPVMDGYSATIKIKEMDKKAVIIAQTAFALARDREKALAAGCDEYLAKPLLKKDLFSVIEKFFK